jgi:hypothetical protein
VPPSAHLPRTTYPCDSLCVVFLLGVRRNYSITPTSRTRRAQTSNVGSGIVQRASFPQATPCQSRPAPPSATPTSNPSGSSRARVMRPQVAFGLARSSTCGRTGFFPTSHLSQVSRSPCTELPSWPAPIPSTIFRMINARQSSRSSRSPARNLACDLTPTIRR